MIVAMKTKIGGFRDGRPWPGVGGLIDLPDHEAADMIANGYCEESDADEIEQPETESDETETEDGGEAGDSESDETETAEPLGDLKKADLLDVAAELDIEGRSAMNKAQLAEAIENARS